MNIQQMFDWSVDRNPDKLALDWVAGDRSYSYAELLAETQRIGQGLNQNLGLKSGDTVAIFAPNIPEFILTLITSWRFDLTAVPLNFRSAAGELPYFLNHSEVDALVFHESLRDKVDSVRGQLPIDRFVEIGDNPPEWAIKFDALQTSEPAKSPPDVTDTTLANLVFTGGTTGQPKCIPVDHATRFYRSNVFLYRDGIREGDNVGLLLPLYHSLGLTVLLATFQAGGTLTLFPKPDPELVLKSIEQREINAIQGVPSIFKGLLESDAIDKYDTSSLHEITTAGQVITENVFNQATQKLCSRFRNIYGTTETMHICYTRESIPAVGKPSPFQNIRIVEPHSNDPDAIVNTGNIGEVIARMDGPESFDGYWKDPETTNRVVHDGWFFTGDLAYRDEENRHWVVGRTDDMIISGGENISPSEVENVLLTHSGVQDVGVIGVPSDALGEEVVAFVVATNDVDEESLDRYCKQQEDFADFKRPRQYRFVDQIPTTAVGKTDRVALSEMV